MDDRRQDHIAQLQQENNELRQMLALKETHIANIENSTAYKMMQRLLHVKNRVCGRAEQAPAPWKLPLKNHVRRAVYPISVVVPNYNYEAFLHERIGTIAYQTIRPAEIIFLDDCSTDGSVAAAKKLLDKTGIPYRMVQNTENAGCFMQWLKGIALAQNELIWIAEADDACAPTLLEELVGRMRDEDVVLAYVQSEMVDENGNAIGGYLPYLAELDDEKWRADYVSDGAAEITVALGAKNTIPNASACLMRKTALAGLEQVLPDYSAVGDWFTYLYAVQRGKIAFCAQPLNRHRRHSKSIIYRAVRDFGVYLETNKMRNYILDHYELSPRAKEVMAKCSARDLQSAQDLLARGEAAKGSAQQMEVLRERCAALARRCES